MLNNRIYLNKNNASDYWKGSCLASEASFHQIAPYIGKMKSSMAKVLINRYTKTAETILDPFVGSGTIALESIIAKRKIICSDINPYAVTLTNAKISAPRTLESALKKANKYLELAQINKKKVSMQKVPRWVKSFYHPKTLREVLALFNVLKRKQDYFMMACLLGILHHQRPGFLSYPASHLVPYLRSKKYPKDIYKEMYKYREVSPRLIAKIKRVYKRVPLLEEYSKRLCRRVSVDKLRLRKNSIDAIITSPPYMNALDYARDNRLRMWFLGYGKFEKYDKPINNRAKFIKLMERGLQIFHRVLKKDGKCILVIGQVRKSRRHFNVAKIVVDLAVKKIKGFECKEMIEDVIPDIRRSRRHAQGSKKEWIVVLIKKN